MEGVIINKYNRYLGNTANTERFLIDALSLDEIDEYGDVERLSKVILKVTSAEMQLRNTIGLDTLTHKDNRLAPYQEDRHRKTLRKEIFKELITKSRLESDDDIVKGKGAALPLTSLQKDKIAFCVIGLPASGKSEVTNVISDSYGAMIIDSDYAKRKFPEYYIDFGADIVHRESTVVTFGGKEEFAQESSVLEYAVRNGCNIVVPKVGNNSEVIDSFAENLKYHGYSTHLVLVRLDRKKATIRALNRYLRTKRYVSLPLIFDVYSNDPTITFYDLERSSSYFDSFTMISSDVPIGDKKKIIFTTDENLISL